MVTDKQVRMLMKLILQLVKYFPSSRSDPNYSLVDEDNPWLPVRFVLNGKFRPAGATTLPNGDVIVLEIHWFEEEDARMEVRLRRIRKQRLISIRRDELLVGEEIAHFGETKSETIDRFEGIANCINKNGDTLLYLISDDNWPNAKNQKENKQRTILLMFKLFDDH